MPFAAIHACQQDGLQEVSWHWRSVPELRWCHQALCRLGRNLVLEDDTGLACFLKPPGVSASGIAPACRNSRDLRFLLV